MISILAKAFYMQGYIRSTSDPAIRVIRPSNHNTIDSFNGRFRQVVWASKFWRSTPDWPWKNNFMPDSFQFSSKFIDVPDRVKMALNPNFSIDLSIVHRSSRLWASCVFRRCLLEREMRRWVGFFRASNVSSIFISSSEGRQYPTLHRNASMEAVRLPQGFSSSRWNCSYCYFRADSAASGWSATEVSSINGSAFSWMHAG